MIREVTFSRVSLMAAINRRISCPAACDISLRTRRTSCMLFIGGLFVQEFQGRHENRIADSQVSVDTVDVSKLVGVRQVPTVPCDEKVTTVEGGGCEVESISLRIRRHDMVADVGVNDLGDGFIQVDERKISDQLQCCLAVRKVSCTKFGFDRQAGHQVVSSGEGVVEPPAGPVSACHHLRFWPLIVVETCDRGFDVDSRHAMRFRSQRSNTAREGQTLIDRRLE